MKKYKVMGVVLAFIGGVLAPTWGSAGVPLFEQELGAFRQAQTAFLNMPNAEILNSTLVAADTLFKALGARNALDRESLLSAHGQEMCDRAQIQNDQFILDSGQALKSANIVSTLHHYQSALPAIPNDESAQIDHGGPEVARSLCEMRASCALPVERFSFMKDTIYGWFQVALARHRASFLITCEKEQRHPTQKALEEAWQTFDRYNTCYNQVSLFYWGVEASLVRAVMKDREVQATDETSLFQPLWGLWSDEGAAEKVCANMMNFLQDRWSILVFSFEAAGDQSPSEIAVEDAQEEIS